MTLAKIAFRKTYGTIPLTNDRSGGDAAGQCRTGDIGLMTAIGKSPGYTGGFFMGNDKGNPKRPIQVARLQVHITPREG